MRFKPPCSEVVDYTSQYFTVKFKRAFICSTLKLLIITTYSVWMAHGFSAEKVEFNGTSTSIRKRWSCCQSRSASQLLCQNLVPLKNIFLRQRFLVLPLECVDAFFQLLRKNEGRGVLQKWKRKDNKAFAHFLETQKIKVRFYQHKFHAD